MLEATLDQLGVAGRQLIETNTIIGATEFLKEGLACALVPWSAVQQEAREGHLRLRRIAGASPVFDYAVYQSSERPLSSAACAVRRCVMDVVETLSTTGRWPHTRL